MTPLKKQKLNSDGEPLRRYHEAIKIMERIEISHGKGAWQEGETIDEVICDLRKFLAYEELEREIFGQATKPEGSSCPENDYPDYLDEEVFESADDDCNILRENWQDEIDTGAELRIKIEQLEKELAESNQEKGRYKRAREE